MDERSVTEGCVAAHDAKMSEMANKPGQDGVGFADRFNG
jgi:hypothetical protein